MNEWMKKWKEMNMGAYYVLKKFTTNSSQEDGRGL